jgi:hypothetical protein
MSKPNIVWIIKDGTNEETGEVFLELNGVWSPVGTSLPSFEGYNLVRMPQTTYDLHIQSALGRVANLKTFMKS